MKFENVDQDKFFIIETFVRIDIKKGHR